MKAACAASLSPCSSAVRPSAHEADASKRVAVHVVGFLDRLETAEAGAPRAREISGAAQALAEIPGDSGGRTDRGLSFQRDGFFEAPARFRRVAELEVRPGEREPGVGVPRIDLDRALEKGQTLFPPSHVRGAESGEIRSVRSRRVELHRSSFLSEGLLVAAETREVVSEPEARLGELRIGGDRPACVALGELELASVRLERKPHRVHGGQPRQRRSVSRVRARRFLEEDACLIQRSLLEAVEEAAPARVPLVGVDAGRRPGRARLDAGLQRLGGAGRQPVLDREHLLERSVELFGKDGVARRAVAELRRHSQPRADALKSSGQHPAAAQGAAEPRLLRPAGAGLANPVARDQRDSRKPREVRRQALGETAADPLVVGISREVDEVDDGERVGKGHQQLAGGERPQVREEGGRARVPLFGIAREGTRQENGSLGRDSLPANRRHVRQQNRGDAVGGRFAGKRRAAGEHLVQDGSQGEEVGPFVEGLALQLLRRHVAEGADHGARLRERDFRRRLRLRIGVLVHARDAEVEKLSQIVRGHHHVLGLDVPVEDSGLVGVSERFQKRSGDRERLRKRQRPAAQPIAERLSRDVLHGQERDAVGLAGLVERGDRGMLQPSAGRRFAKEPRARFGRQRGGKDLDRRGATEGEVPGEKDLSHASRAERLLDPIVGEDPADHALLAAAYNPANSQSQLGSLLRQLDR